MPHVVPADDVGAVGEAVRMLVVGGPQQQRRGIDRAAGHDHDVGGVVSALPLRSTCTPVDFAARSSWSRAASHTRWSAA